MYSEILELLQDRLDLLKVRGADGYTLEDMLTNHQPYNSINETSLRQHFKAQKEKFLELIRRHS